MNATTAINLTADALRTTTGADFSEVVENLRTALTAGSRAYREPGDAFVIDEVGDEHGDPENVPSVFVSEGADGITVTAVGTDHYRVVPGGGPGVIGRG